MTKTDELVDYNEVDAVTLVALTGTALERTALNAPNKGNGDLPDLDDCTFDDEQQEQHQSKYGDSIFYEPYVTKPPRGSKTFNISSE